MFEFEYECILSRVILVKGLSDPIQEVLKKRGLEGQLPQLVKVGLIESIGNLQQSNNKNDGLGNFDASE